MCVMNGSHKYEVDSELGALGAGEDRARLGWPREDVCMGRVSSSRYVGACTTGYPLPVT